MRQHARKMATGVGADAGSLRLDRNNRYRFDFKHVNDFSNATCTNGVLKDHGAIYLTFKTTI